MSDNVTSDASAANTPGQVTIDGKTYNLSDLTAEAQAQLRNIQEVDRKTVALQNELKSLETWRMVHSHSLKAELDKIGG